MFEERTVKTALAFGMFTYFLMLMAFIADMGAYSWA